MEITAVKIFPAKENDRLKAYAQITLNYDFVVHDLKIIQGKRGLFVSMPSRRRKDGSFKDIAHPTSSERRKAIEEAVLKEFDLFCSQDVVND